MGSGVQGNFHFYEYFNCIRILIFTGFFLEPTVFTDVEDEMFIAIEESFGPVMVISKFADG